MAPCGVRLRLGSCARAAGRARLARGSHELGSARTRATTCPGRGRFRAAWDQGRRHAWALPLASVSSPPSIFVSYSHDDRELARALAVAIREQGLTVWIDDGELKVGDSLIERIATAIAEIDFFLALVSEASRKSNWCRKELALAVTGELGREGVKVMPVRVDGAPMPESLADVYYLELDAGNVAEVAARSPRPYRSTALKQKPCSAVEVKFRPLLVRAARPRHARTSFKSSSRSASSASWRRVWARLEGTVPGEAPCTGSHYGYPDGRRPSGRSGSSKPGIGHLATQRCTAPGSPQSRGIRSCSTGRPWRNLSATTSTHCDLSSKR